VSLRNPTTSRGTLNLIIFCGNKNQENCFHSLAFLLHYQLISNDSLTMGNAVGKSKMNTWAVSNRVSMNHDRLTELRNACFEETRDPLAPLTRSQLRKCLEKTSISYSPDGEFVLDLFTMWDVSVEDQVEQVPFLLGLCPLACEESETLTSFLRFALGLLDVENTGFIIEPDLLLALKSTWCLMSCFLLRCFCLTKLLNPVVS